LVDQYGCSFKADAKHEDLSLISSETFKLPGELSARLKAVCDQIYDGVGFQIVRGFNSEKYTAQQNAIIFAGIGAHICPERGFVDRWGNVISKAVSIHRGRPRD
jgi:hypothetical protein